ncbi:hypothetical protein AD998_21900 [bacterium 336/3]|nr:hypothetical protein AD998_21900 [bacterium 336/3]
MEQPNRQYTNSEAYRYGFNSHEKSEELGNGIYTAEFWEYDSKIARRWNLDPVSQTNISDYAVFKNSPILYKDSNGDIPIPAIVWGIAKLIMMGMAVETGTQITANLVTGKDWHDLDYVDIGVSGGLNAITVGQFTYQKQAYRFITLSTKMSKATPYIGEALKATIDVKIDGIETIFNGSKSLIDTGVDAVFGIGSGGFVGLAFKESNPLMKSSFAKEIQQKYSSLLDKEFAQTAGLPFSERLATMNRLYPQFESIQKKYGFWNHTFSKGFDSSIGVFSGTVGDTIKDNVKGEGEEQKIYSSIPLVLSPNELKRQTALQSLLGDINKYKTKYPAKR